MKFWFYYLKSLYLKLEKVFTYLQIHLCKIYIYISVHAFLGLYFEMELLKNFYNRANNCNVTSNIFQTIFGIGSLLNIFCTISELSGRVPT